jgi:hypothetical protein
MYDAQPDSDRLLLETGGRAVRRAHHAAASNALAMAEVAVNLANRQQSRCLHMQKLT